MSLGMQGVRSCPSRLFPAVYNRLADARLRHAPADVGDCWQLQTPDGEWLLPHPKDAIRITHVANGHPRSGYRRLLDKYQYSGFVELTTDDTVLDVGAYIGEFTRAASDTGATVAAAVEPDPHNAVYCRANTDTEVLETALWDEPTTLTFTVATDGSESSAFGADAGGGEERDIEATTLQRVLGARDVSFLKLEAEGAEPECLDGLGEERPGKVAVDCSPERNGRSTLVMCRNRLSDLGYATRVDGDVLFGRFDD